ncbi:CG33998 [Drosophila busckii]|uniref:CG33998 n=1 Tax=Drosophila busckii TaxID=30019 RepID=A0A0M3QVA3_DROBS|nr:probable salivary secreted peptide isoform X2 [Drosophila busckii]ALC42069.1 CG33998 [Drosophila busckii]
MHKVGLLTLLLGLGLLLCVDAEGGATELGSNRSHSVAWGARIFRDTHLERVIITQKSKWLRVVTRDYHFQQKQLTRRITQIVITDQVGDGKGGYASLVEGGPQNTFAKIHFKSQRGLSFSFIVDIYGI